MKSILVLLVFLALLFIPTNVSALLYAVDLIHQAPMGNQIGGVRINNIGEVVWDEYPVGNISAWEIYSSERGQITNNSIADCCPAINNLGQIAWQAALGPGSNPQDWEIVLDGVQLTFNSTFDGEAKINNLGEVIWDASDGIRSSIRGLVASGVTASPEINN